MLRIMANENFDTWRTNTKVTLETVRATKEYLDREFAKCEDWGTLNKSIKGLFDDIRGLRK